MYLSKHFFKSIIIFLITFLIYSCSGSHDRNKNKTGNDTIDTTKQVKQNVPQQNPNAGKKTLIIKGTNVNLRVTPDLNAIRIKQLKTNDTCEILEQGKKETINDATDYWYKIRFKKWDGWIFGAFTSLKLPAESGKQEKHEISNSDKK
jgi:hypothetical protein